MPYDHVISFVRSPSTFLVKASIHITPTNTISFPFQVFSSFLFIESSILRTQQVFRQEGVPPRSCLSLSASSVRMRTC
jgi:hypothetical protein